MSTVAGESCARALQYGPTEGFARVKDCIAEVMAAEGMEVDPDEVLVTTGGQQVIDLVCKTLLDPGDVVVAEAPTYPGRDPDLLLLPGRRRPGARWIATACGSTSSRRRSTSSSAAGRRPKFIYTVPNFHNPAGVTMSLERRRELVRIAGERELLVLEDNPYGLLRYEGEPLPHAALARRRVRDLRQHVLQDPVARACGSAGPSAPAPILAKMQIGKQGSDLCSSSISQYFVSAYFDAGPWDDYVRSLLEIYRRRRDVMLDALAEHFPREAEWTHPQGGLFIWATMPDYIDTTDLLARALREQVAFVPGPGGVRRRPRRLGDAAELLRRRRGRRSARASAGSARSSASRWRCTARSPAHSPRSPARAAEPRADVTAAAARIAEDRAPGRGRDRVSGRRELAKVLRMPVPHKRAG